MGTKTVHDDALNVLPPVEWPDRESAGAWLIERGYALLEGLNWLGSMMAASPDPAELEALHFVIGDMVTLVRAAARMAVRGEPTVFRVEPSVSRDFHDQTARLTRVIDASLRLREWGREVEPPDAFESLSAALRDRLGVLTVEEILQPRAIGALRLRPIVWGARLAEIPPREAMTA